MRLSAELLTHLVGLYPVGLLRDRWKVKGAASKRDFIAGVLQATSQKDVVGFCSENHGSTKLHVHVFDGGWKEHGQPPETLMKNHPEERVSSQGDTSIFLVPTVTFTLYTRSDTGSQTTAKMTEVKFPWPIKVRVERNVTIVAFTILAKNIEAYLPDGTFLVSRTTRDLDEQHVLSEFKNLRSGSALASVDLNKGVKALWDQDQIDAMHSRWKSPRSTLSETMDESYLLKRDRPEAYKDAVKAPLYKTLFKVLKFAGNCPSQFATNPSMGELMFNRFAKTPDEVENVLRAILRAN